MFEKSMIPTLRSLHLPQRYSVDQTVDGLAIRRLESPARRWPATFEAYRSLGHRCRRLRAVTQEGDTLVVEFAAFPNDYGSAVAGVLRARVRW